MARARQAFRDIQFHPTILRDVAEVDTGWEVLGARVALPFGIAPTGFTRLMQTEGEIAGAHAAARAGIPFSLSTLGTSSIEDVKAANPHGRNWFQLYMWKDRDRSMALVERAAAAGFDTLLVTVDVPVAGARLRDTRNGMSIPPALTLRTVLDAVPHPRWWFDLLTTEPLSFASLGPLARHGRRIPGHHVRPHRDVRRPGLDQVAVAEQVGGQGNPDAGRRQVGGRSRCRRHRAVQPRRPPARPRARCRSICCPPSRAKLGGDTEIVLDTGIMSGADIVAAIALGARFTLVGRAYLYGLMAGGEAGVDRAIEILSEQVARTMRLLGVTCLEELAPRHVTQLSGCARARLIRPAQYGVHERRVRAESQSLAIRDFATLCWYACDVCGACFTCARKATAIACGM